MADKSPDAFRTISEVANWLGVQTHVLRFWESRFTQIKPVKRAGGRRYYRPADMELIGGIKVLLHDNGMTIRGVQKILREQGIKAVVSFTPGLDGSEGDAPMAVDVIPSDNVVSLQPASKPAPSKRAAPKPAPVAQPQADLPLDPAPEPAPEAAAARAKPAPAAEEPAADDAQAKLIALRNRLAALRERGAGS